MSSSGFLGGRHDDGGLGFEIRRVVAHVGHDSGDPAQLFAYAPVPLLRYRCV